MDAAPAAEKSAKKDKQEKKPEKYEAAPVSFFPKQNQPISYPSLFLVCVYVRVFCCSLFFLQSDV